MRLPESALGPLHDEVLAILELLDHLPYCDIGDWSRSISTKTTLLDGYEAILGADHPDLADDVLGLAQARDLSAFQSCDERGNITVPCSTPWKPAHPNEKSHRSG